jgi:TolA-binding protein
MQMQTKEVDVMSGVDTQAADAARQVSEGGSTQSVVDDRSDAAERLVPVSEAIRYRRRAQQAEQQFEQMQRELEQTRQRLAETDAQVMRLERRQRIDQLLAESDTIDMQAARLLTESAIEAMDEPDVESAVEELRRRKPYLFGRATLAGAATMGAEGVIEADAVSTAQQEAVTSGHRRDLLRYLRLRRTGQGSR